jgi:hypothetical protein
MFVPGRRLSLGVLVRTLVRKLFGGLSPLRGVALLYVWNFCLLPITSAQQADQVSGDQAASDQATAARVLGAQWKQMSRRAGIIFVGTVLAGDLPVPTNDEFIAAPATIPAVLSTIHVSFRVDRGIAGVESGQLLTIHEWGGASSVHRPMNTGQHVLLFLYSPSRLGFTSPVGGASGEVLLDASGKNVAERKPVASFKSLSAPGPSIPSDPSISSTSSTSSLSLRAGPNRPVRVDQLERAIRSARQAREE